MTLKADQVTSSLVPVLTDAETAAQPKWLLPVRKAGSASFAEQGFPTLRDEDWRFTNVAPLTKLSLLPAGHASVNGAETKVIEESVFTALPGHRLVFVNGHFCAKLSNLKTVSDGARV
jgi:Fe-S cluster assembly protein SufD